jgi:hypothetical protein
MSEEILSDKTLKPEFINKTLDKIKKVIDLILTYHQVNMIYTVEERNKLFCEIIKKTKKDLTTTEMFEKIQKLLYTKGIVGKEESEWLSQQIYDYNKEIFVLHYFYAVLYSYNYDSQIREKITEEHVHKFFYRANEIYKKYKNLLENQEENT